MDGPLALSLGLESRDDAYMSEKPVKRSDSIVSKVTFIRTALHSLFIIFVLVTQRLFNYLNVSAEQIDSVIFSLFVFFQLFNAINARELGNQSIIKSLGKNKLFSCLLIFTGFAQILITEYLDKAFLTTRLGIALWVKIFLTTASIVIVSECYKLVYRLIKKGKNFKKNK